MPALILKTRPKTQSRERLIISISRNVAKKAVQRNLIKRRIRTILRPLMKNNNEILVTVKPEAAQRTYKELKQEIEIRLGKIHQ